MTFKQFFHLTLLFFTNPRMVADEIAALNGDIKTAWLYFIGSIAFLQVTNILLYLIPGYMSFMNFSGTEALQLTDELFFAVSDVFFSLTLLFVAYGLFSKFGKKVSFATYVILGACIQVASLVPLFGIVVATSLGSQDVTAVVSTLLALYVLVLIITAEARLFELKTWKVFLINVVGLVTASVVVGLVGFVLQ